ncbi:putative conserved membrane protein [Mycobacteroides abscessus subsp. massiliense]|nr:putative conserved membrane protein [Mycobacteroides abscessus subsp. massiliense]SKH92856.1 putative conserved membrane protein [Mycobacteroides abscessus subsp. massiliense]SKI13246.1 putative conserved membrane protein [Mycobacteroides abscessus subsp. massiliense]SKJ98952.1 putative conserved membrane protein [Mycobacteroides abscessus subsp. massiliense]SKK28470.1 putative conserved membrane protein [Mycobacteroides abscessus subsp. massiliense]
MPMGSPLRLPSVSKLIGLAVLIVMLASLSVSLYWWERGQDSRVTVLEDSGNPDRVNIRLLIQKVDPAAARVSAQLQVRGEGALIDEYRYLKEDVTVVSNAVTNRTVVAKSNERPDYVPVEFALREGVVTDYPFDSYKSTFFFNVRIGSDRSRREVPVRVVIENIDAFFTVTPKQEAIPQADRQGRETGATKLPQSAIASTATIERSTSTLVFAVFIMVFMWCLTIAALIAAWYVGSGKLGLFWSGLGFLGTLLFALIPLRNAVPGNPPIGSVIDFAAFFIAEGVVSTSMIITVLHGYYIEASNRAHADRSK